MEFNEKFYSENLKHSQHRVGKIIDLQRILLDYLIEYLISSSDAKQLTHCDSFLHLVAKIRFNIESINLLMESFLKSDYRFKLSINVLYRSIVDDLVNIKYLLSFVDFGEDDKRSLNNELDILHKEHLISMVKGIEAEIEFQKYLSNLKNEPFDDYSKAIENLKYNNAYLLEASGNWRSNKDIRNTTNKIFLDLLNSDGKWNGFISETKKLEFIEKSNKNTNELTFLFKYYSQYQHFSPKSHDYINADIEQDLFFYFVTIGEILITLDLLIKLLNFQDESFIKQYNKFLQSNFSELAAEFT